MPKPLTSFAARILMLLVAIGVVPLIGLGLIQDYYTRGMLDKLNEDRVTRRLEAALHRVNTYIADRFGELETLADHPLVRWQLLPDQAPPGQYAARAVTAFLGEGHPSFGVLLVSDGGEVMASLVESSNTRDVDWNRYLDRLPFRNLYQERDRGLLGPVRLEAVEGAIVFLFQRVYRDPERNWPIGLIVMHLGIDALVELMEISEDDALVPFLQSPLGEYFPGVADGARGPTKVVASTALLEGWELVMSVEEHRLMEPMVQLRQTLAVLMVVTLAAVIAIIALFYRRSALRIRKLTEGAEAIAHGNLQWRLEDRGTDEISALSGAFNRMAERLDSLIDATVQSEKMASLGKLATTIAHEVRNPLASIKTGVQVVRENLSDPEQERILGNVVAEIDRLNRVASGLLNFARPVPTRSEDASVDEIIERVRSLVERQAAKQNIRISAEVEPSLTIRVDTNQMQQVLMNVVLNSLHAMPEGGALTFRAHQADHRVVIDVIDTGVGMAPDAVERAVRPFATANPDGTGIGLSVSHQLVERNQGHMVIQSLPDQGTTVSLSFPAA